MPFTCTLTTRQENAQITLSGELDASSAPLFKAEIEKVTDVKRLLLLMTDLEFMASAGLRVLIFAKQKMGTGVDIYVVGAQEGILDTLKKTGFDRSVVIVDTYDD